jgi:hypothetical protein
MSPVASTPALTTNQDFTATPVPASLEMAKLLTSLVLRAVAISVVASALIVIVALAFS